MKQFFLDLSVSQMDLMAESYAKKLLEGDEPVPPRAEITNMRTIPTITSKLLAPTPIPKIEFFGRLPDARDRAAKTERSTPGSQTPSHYSNLKKRREERQMKSKAISL